MELTSLVSGSHPPVRLDGFWNLELAVGIGNVKEKRIKEAVYRELIKEEIRAKNVTIFRLLFSLNGKSIDFARVMLLFVR